MNSLSTLARPFVLFLSGVTSVTIGCAASIPPEAPGEEFVCSFFCQETPIAIIDPRLMGDSLTLGWGDPIGSGMCFHDSNDAADFCLAAAEFAENVLNDQGELFRCADVLCTALEGRIALNCRVECPPGLPDFQVYDEACRESLAAAAAECHQVAMNVDPSCGSFVGATNIPCELPGAPTVFVPTGFDLCRLDLAEAAGFCDALAAGTETSGVFGATPASCVSTAFLVEDQVSCQAYATYDCTPLALANPTGFDASVDGCECIGGSGNCGVDLCDLFKPNEQDPVTSPETALDPPPAAVAARCNLPDPLDNTLRDTDWVFEIDSEQSFFVVDGESSFGSGALGIDGGFCPGGTCSVTLRGLVLNQLDELDFVSLGFGFGGGQELIHLRRLR